MSVCFEPRCIQFFMNKMVFIPSFIKDFAEFLSYIFTVFGVYIALKSYVSSTEATKASVHLMHFNSFREYIQSEIDRADYVSWKSINVVKLYNIIYDKSHEGCLTVSVSYRNLMDELNNKISESNAKNASSLFDYKHHQTEVKKVLSKMGIEIERKPRNDFYLMEKFLFDFIDKVNSEFCRLTDKRITTRKYN